MRIAVVGPTHPFKGGIAQHTTELARQLSRAGHTVTLISWHSQYPARLYPGELVVPDGVVEVPLTVPVHRVLNWYDPSSWWRAGAGLRDADAIVVAHSNPFQVPAYLSLLTSASRGSRTPTRILIAHNVAPHESGSWQDRAVDQFARVVDVVIVHSEQERESARRHLPSAEIRCIPLAPHGPAMEAGHGQAHHRRVHKDGERIRLLAFGFIRPYKGLPLLVEAMKSAPQVELTIRGECWDDECDAQIRLAAQDSALHGRVDYQSGYVSAAEIDALFAQHDVAVLPYLEATGSQNTALAQAYGRPVIVSDIPALTHGVENGVNGLIVPAGDRAAWSTALSRLTPAQVQTWSDNVRKVDVSGAWGAYVETILAPVAAPATGATATRQAHAVSDPVSRAAKAQALVSTLQTVTTLAGARVLDDGCGSGYIAAHLATVVGPEGKVVGVDQVDERQARERYDFHLLEDSILPFGDASFDVVVSNHVLEHVGEHSDQLEYLSEIRRVLRPGGWLYLAVPNRFRLMEAHYRLPLLSWLPQGAADRLVRLTGRGEWYDVTPVSRSGLQTLLEHVGLHVTDITSQVARRELGKLPGGAARIAEVPDAVLRPALQMVPTFVVLAQRG